MKRKLIFDASVLVNSHLSGEIYTTGIYRVSHEILAGLIDSEAYSIYLYDVYEREREVRKYILPKYRTTEVFSVDSYWYKAIVYPLFDLADFFRSKEFKCNRALLKGFLRFSKNSFNTLGKFLRYLEKGVIISKKNNDLSSSDIYFSTYNRIPLNQICFSSLRKVIIIHDLLPVIHPEYFFDEENRQIFEAILESISRKDIVMCVSESTRRDLLATLKTISTDNVHVIHLGGSDCFRPDLTSERNAYVRRKYRIPENKEFFLSVCTLEPRKNIGLLLSSYEKLLTNLTESDIPLLVLTGAIGWKTQSLVEKIKQINSKYPGSIILTGFIPDEDLVVLYSHTIAFVYPSLYEGFGLPPLEAMKCGAPVITSKNSSLPEVVGDAAILIDATDVGSLYNALKTCLNSEITKVLREKSIRRASMFTWDKTVQKIIDILA